jgi:uncharacterized protein (DUF433 family)
MMNARRMAMAITGNEFVTVLADDVWRVGRTRVSLNSVVIFHREGYSPEGIVALFPTLSPNLVIGALAWYEEHRQHVDQVLVRREAEWEDFRIQSKLRNAPMLNKMRERMAAIAEARS